MLDEQRFSSEVASVQRRVEHLRHDVRETPTDDRQEVWHALDKLTREVSELRAFQKHLGQRQVDLPSDRNEAVSRYRALFASTADAILLVNELGIITEVNACAAQLLAHGTDKLVGMPLERVLVSPFAEALDGSRAWRGETEARRLDGREVPVEASAIPLEHSDSARTLWTLRNISERRRLARLQEEFLSMAAHELKTPLTSLKGFAQLLQRGIGGQRAADVIVQQADHLNALVGDLLDVARLESGRISIQPREMDLRAVIARAVAQAGALGTGHSVDLEPIDHPIVGTWDERRLEQVMINLLSNAIVHAPQSQRVRIRVSEERECVHITVRDHGPGISPAAMSNLFNRFYRVDNPTGRGVEGMGLGLYICRIIIEAHDGAIHVASKLGDGCAFTITLPRHR